MAMKYVGECSRDSSHSYVWSSRLVHASDALPSLKQILPEQFGCFCEKSDSGQGQCIRYCPVHAVMPDHKSHLPAISHAAGLSASHQIVFSHPGGWGDRDGVSLEKTSSELDSEESDSCKGKQSRAQSLNLESDEYAKKRIKKEKMVKRRDEENILDIAISVLMQQDEDTRFDPKDRLSNANRKSAMGRVYNKTAIQKRMIKKLMGGPGISQEFLNSVHYDTQRGRDTNKERKRLNRIRESQGQEPLPLEEVDATKLVEEYIRLQARNATESV